jgi:hypothetical protein
MRWLKHAFAVGAEAAAEPTDEQRAAAERFCREVVRRHLTAPALIALESLRPLNFMIAQGLHFAMPFASLILNVDGLKHFAAFLEHRGSFDYLCRRVEELEAEAALRDAQAAGRSDRSTSPD